MKHIYTFFCLFLISGVSSAEQWLCIGDQATGFVYNHKGSGTWTNVPIGGGKWIISHLEALPNIPYVVRKFGGDVSSYKSRVFYICEEEFGGGDLMEYLTDSDDLLYCGLPGIGQFTFNRHNNRYTRSLILGYYENDAELKAHPHESKTPIIEIGTCSSF